MPPLPLRVDKPRSLGRPADLDIGHDGDPPPLCFGVGKDVFDQALARYPDGLPVGEGPCDYLAVGLLDVADALQLAGGEGALHELAGEKLAVRVALLDGVEVGDPHGLVRVGGVVVDEVGLEVEVVELGRGHFVVVDAEGEGEVAEERGQDVGEHDERASLCSRSCLFARMGEIREAGVVLHEMGNTVIDLKDVLMYFKDIPFLNRRQFVMA